MIGFLGALSLIVVTRLTHATVGTDGVSYLAIADRLAGGHGLGFWLEDPLVTWPPLWPAMIAAVRWATGWRSDVAAVVLNAALTVVLSMQAGWLLYRLGVSRRTASWALALIVLGPITLVLAAVVQTEIVFTVITLGVVIGAQRFRDGDGARWLVGAAVLTSAAFLARYAGLYLIPLVALWLWLPRPAAPFQPRCRFHWVEAISYSVGSFVVPAGWMLRNHHVSGTYLGPRYPSGIGIVRNTAEALAGVTKFLVGTRSFPFVPGVLIAIAVVGFFAWLAAPLVFDDPPLRPPVEAVLVAAGTGAGLVVIVGAGTVAALVYSRSQYGFDNLDVRLLFPSLVLLVVLGALVVDRTVVAQPPSWRPHPADLRQFVRRPLLALLPLWIVLQLALSLALLGPLNHILSDLGFNASRARTVASSPLWRELPKGCALYSNNPFDLYRSGIEAKLSPRVFEWQSIQPTGELDRLVADSAAGDDICLAWVTYTDDPNFLDRRQLRERVGLEEIGRDGDLVLYRVVTSA